MRTRVLRLSDIGQDGEKEYLLQPFQMILHNFLIEKPQLYLGLKNIFAIRQLEQFGWRADTPQFIGKSGTKIPCGTFYHYAIHYFLVKKFGAQLKGRPLFTLFCEAITSQSQYYFDLEVLRNFGPTPEILSRLNEETLPRAEDIFGAKKAEPYLLDLMNSDSETESFFQYRECVLEMFKTYQYVLEIAQNGEDRGPLELTHLNPLFTAGKYAPLTCSYNFGSNVMYALVNCKNSTLDDLHALKKCRDALEKAESFSSFLLTLGLTDYRNQSKSA